MNAQSKVSISCLVASVAALFGITFASTALANWSPFPGGVQLDLGLYPVSDVRSASDGSGGLLVAWAEFHTSNVPDWHTHVQRLDALGNELWTHGGVAIGEGDGLTHQQNVLDVCSDGAGGAFVAWDIWEVESQNFDGKVQHIDSFGSTTWGSGAQFSNGHINFQGGCNLEPDGNGGVIVAWLDHRNNYFTSCAADPQLFAQRFDASGNRLWTDGGVQLSRQQVDGQTSDVTAHRPVPFAGGAYFVWTGMDASCSPSHVLIQRLDTNGSEKFVHGGIPLGVGTNPIAHAAPDGSDCMVTTIGSTAAVQRVDPGGSILWTEPLSSSTSGGTANSNGLNGMLVAWFSAGHYFVQNVGPNGQLQMPVSSAAQQGTDLGSNAMTFDSSAPPCVVSDGKQGLLLASEGTLPSAPLPGIITQGANLSGRQAFQQIGVQISLPGQSSTTVTGAAGTLNYGLFAWGNSNGVFAQQISLSDLDATNTPPGWAGPLVPRSLAGSTNTSVPSTVLFEGTGTWLNWVVTQRGPNPTPAFQSRVYVDGSYFWGLNIPDGAGSGYYPLLNLPVAPYSIPGGPHTLTLYSDESFGPDLSVDEASEADDVWSQQWIWEPSWVVPGHKFDNFAPLLGKFPIPNGNGHKLMAPSAALAPNAWVVSDAARRGPTFDPGTGGVVGYGDSYGLQLYDLPVGSGEYTHMIGGSHQTFNGTNFVLALSPAAPESIYTLEVRDSVQDANPDSSWFDFESGDGHMGPAAGSAWTNQTMAAGELADMYMLNAGARQIMKLSLRKSDRQPGPVGHLAFEAFEPIAGAVYARGGGISSHTVNADIETLTFVATHSGPYMVVVYRTDGSNAGTPVAYDFASSNTQTLDTSPQLPAELSFRGALPNPTMGPTDLSFALPKSSDVRLEIYDVNGRRVRVLVSSEQEPGDHRVHWDGRGDSGAQLGAGLYFARLTAGGHLLTRRVSLLR